MKLVDSQYKPSRAGQKDKLFVLALTAQNVSVKAPELSPARLRPVGISLGTLILIPMKILAFPPASGRLPDGAAVSVPRLGFSSGSAWLQTLVFETDTAGGEMAGGM